MSDPEIVVVGAGAAGLAAAAVLRLAGRSVLVLEAGPSIGGRARTVRPPALGRAAIDEGATWLHEVGRNPLVDLARASGRTLLPAHQGDRRLLVGAHAATDAEEEAYGEADAAWHRAAIALADGPDRPLAQDHIDLPPHQAAWLANVEAWDGSIIAAVDADRLSLHDWRRNLLGEDDLLPEDGVGCLLAELVGPHAGPVQCDTPVLAIDWQSGDGMTVTTARGAIRARGCIVTVSTGVLRHEQIRFTPQLPAETLAALDGLPMGLLSKLALPLADPELPFLDLEPGTLLEQRLERPGDPLMLLTVQPDAAPYVSGFFGGDFAWSFVGREEQALDEARARLAGCLGTAALDALGPGGFVSHWGSDPLFRGGYSYARPGHAGARAVLGQPLGGGRLVLAGEACRTDGLAGTVGGAMLDGERAAGVMLAWLGDRGPARTPWQVFPGDNGFPPTPVRV
ncbi:flavin monoamine oxidase family protein [Lichenicola sp.]|uniref:flavin monoamine oxidase family protein n=1 Tax=Lichenicola sp. TaxID=2804529 RepID=UPI003AFFD851